MDSILQSMADSLASYKLKAKNQIKPLVAHVAKYLFIEASPENQQDWVKDIQHRILPVIQKLKARGVKYEDLESYAEHFIARVGLRVLLLKEYKNDFNLQQPLSPELLLEATLHLLSLTDPVEETLKTYLKDVE